MDAYLGPLVLCCVYITIIRQRKKDFGGKKKKTKKNNQKNVYVRMAYNSCVYVCVN